MIRDIKQLQAQLQSTTTNRSCVGCCSLLTLACRGCGWLCSSLLCCFCCSTLGPCYSTPPPETDVPKLVVFIDDLDRVPPNKVVNVLEAVNIILSASGVTSVIGAVSLQRVS